MNKSLLTLTFIVSSMLCSELMARRIEDPTSTRNKRLTPEERAEQATKKCNDTIKSVTELQGRQFGLKNGEGKTLLELEKEFDRALAHHSIMQGLNAISNKFLKGASEFSDNNTKTIEGYLSQLETAHQGSLRMVSMEDTLQILKTNAPEHKAFVEANKDNPNASWDFLKSKCGQSENREQLGCKFIRGHRVTGNFLRDTSRHKALIKEFARTYLIAMDGDDSTQQLADYQQILKDNIPEGFEPREFLSELTKQDELLSSQVNSFSKQTKEALTNYRQCIISRDLVGDTNDCTLDKAMIGSAHEAIQEKINQTIATRTDNNRFSTSYRIFAGALQAANQKIQNTTVSSPGANAKKDPLLGNILKNIVNSYKQKERRGRAGVSTPGDLKGFFERDLDKSVDLEILKSDVEGAFAQFGGQQCADIVELSGGNPSFKSANMGACIEALDFNKFNAHFKQSQSKINDLKAQILAIQESKPYKELDQIKNYTATTIKDLCSGMSLITPRNEPCDPFANSESLNPTSNLAYLIDDGKQIAIEVNKSLYQSYLDQDNEGSLKDLSKDCKRNKELKDTPVCKNLAQQYKQEKADREFTENFYKDLDYNYDRYGNLSVSRRSLFPLQSPLVQQSIQGFGTSLMGVHNYNQSGYVWGMNYALTGIQRIEWQNQMVTAINEGQGLPSPIFQPFNYTCNTPAMCEYYSTVF